MRHNKIILISVFVIVIYAIIILLSDTKTLYSEFINANLQQVLTASGFFSLGYFIRSLRFVAMLRFMKIKVPILKNVIIYFTGYAFSLTPGKVGEGIRSKYLKDEFEISIIKSLPTVLAERYYDVVAVLFIIFITAGLTETKSFLAYIGVALLVLFYIAVRGKITAKFISLFNRIKKLQGIQYKILESIGTIETLLQPKIFLQCSILTIISWSVEAIGAYFVFKSFHLKIGVLNGIFTYVTTSLAGAATMLPGGVGGTEASLLGLLLLQGYGYNYALGAVLIIRFFALWYVIIIGVVFTSIYKLNQRNSIRNG